MSIMYTSHSGVSDILKWWCVWTNVNGKGSVIKLLSYIWHALLIFKYGPVYQRIWLPVIHVAKHLFQPDVLSEFFNKDLNDDI